MKRFLVMLFLAGLGSYAVPPVESSQRSPNQEISTAPNPPRQNYPGKKTHLRMTKDSRAAFIRRAQVWKPTDIPNMDLRSGPEGPGAFQPNEHVTCDYTDSDLHGATKKFHCRLENGEIVKVRYGASNGEVQGSVLASRLLWALGFAADRLYPVRVTCRGCSSDPWTRGGSRGEVQEFDPAAIELKPPGHEMWDGAKGRKAGWSWSELSSVDSNHGGAPREQLDALKLLAVFMQHADTKSKQQRLLCQPDGLTAPGTCKTPFLLLHDVGVTFGRANTFNRNSTGSVNYEAWARTSIWKDPEACIGDLSKSFTGSMGDPSISEAGRKFLADLLVQLSDEQLRDLFEVAQVDRRTDSSGDVSTARIEDWVSAFKSKRQEIVANRCRGD